MSHRMRSLKRGLLTISLQWLGARASSRERRLCVTKNAPYACRNFHACAFTRFQKLQQLGRVQIAERAPRSSRAKQAGPDLSGQRCCKLRLNYCLYWQRRLESCSSSSSQQRGWSARMATHWSSHLPTCSAWHRCPHVSSSAKDSFKTFTGARSCQPHHSHFSHGRQNRRSSFCREDLLIL